MTEFGHHFNSNIHLNVETSLPSSGVISGASDISLDSPNSDNLPSFKQKNKCFNNEFKVKKIVSKSRYIEKDVPKIQNNPYLDFENKIHTLNEDRYCSSSSENELGGAEKDDFHFKMNRIVSKKRSSKISKNTIKECNNECYDTSSDEEKNEITLRNMVRCSKNNKKQTSSESGIAISSKDDDSSDSDKDPLDILRVLSKGAPLARCDEEDL
uniref:Uncharacterized protein n=1 Tax=Parastrongyloides trichosuri TaxID=131310 RepID=A0A0N4ZBQ8_PARTI